MEQVSDLIAQFVPGFDPATGTFALPLWAAAAVAALFAGFCLLALLRAGSNGIVGALARLGLLLVGAVAAWAVLDARSGGDLAAQRLALDQRALEIAARALAPGSALACLDGTAGDTVETSCEKALFATPESTAAAVSYVAAELSLLADGSDYAGRSRTSYEMTLAPLRHAAETDRYGIVAHVLTVRDGCTAEQCDAFALFHDVSRVSDNIIGRKYEFYVLRHAPEWPPSALSPVAVNVPPPPPPTSAPVPASTGKTAPNNLFFPSSASIPPVSIMNAEPGGQPAQAGAPADAGGKPPVSGRKTTQPARRSTNPNAQAQGRPVPPPAPAPAPVPAPAGAD